MPVPRTVLLTPSVILRPVPLSRYLAKSYPCHTSENAFQQVLSLPHFRAPWGVVPTYFMASRNGYALPAAMGVAAKRALRLQERRSFLQLSAGGGGGAPGPPLN